MIIISATAQGQIIRKEKIDWIFTIGLSQIAINDWKQGETSGFEFSSSLNLSSSFRIDTFLLRLNIRYASGVQYISNNNNDFEYLIPSDNLLFGETAFVYPVGWKLNPCVSAQFTTQLIESFKLVHGTRVNTASLWDPVTSIESLGFEFSSSSKENYLTSQIGLSIKQIKAEKFTKLTDDYKTHDIKERYKHQSGIQWKTNTKIKITDEVTYRGTLGMFGSFEDLRKWTFSMTNQLNLKVFKSIGIIININLNYDERQMMKLQYIQNIRFGFIISPN